MVLLMGPSLFFSRLSGIFLFGPAAGIMDFYRRDQSATGVEFSDDRGAYRLTSMDNIIQDTIDRVLIEYSEIPVTQKIHFQGFQFETISTGDIADFEHTKIGQACLGTDRSEFGNLDFDLVVGKLIGKYFYRGELFPQTGLCFFLGIPISASALIILFFHFFQYKTSIPQEQLPFLASFYTDKKINSFKSSISILYRHDFHDYFPHKG